MKFGPVAVTEAVGALLVHAVTLEGGKRPKGHRVTAADAEAFAAAGLDRVVVAEMEPTDTAEDCAALILAEALRGPHVRVSEPFTGRANLYAEKAGVLVVDRARVDALNAVDEAITLATLPAQAVVAAGDMVATVKIIPYAVATDAVARAASAVTGGSGAEGTGETLRIAPFVRGRAALIQTVTIGLKESLLDKAAEVTAERLARLGGRLALEERIAHSEAAVADAIDRSLAQRAEMVLVMAGSATVDRRDVIPAAIERAGGRVIRVGMPVDPGNLLVLGEVAGVPVVGLPGCARSPKENGLDWVLSRLAAALPVTSADIAGWGVGGLLAEIPTRPQVRHRAGEAVEERRVAAVILAAGRSTRMGRHKMLIPRHGVPMVRAVAEAALASPARPVVVVVGHEAEAVRDALAGLAVEIVVNADYASGMAGSVRTGIAAVEGRSDAALFCLGDMPDVTPATLGRVIAAFSPEEGRLVCQPSHKGRRGNPVLWSSRYYPSLSRLSGDEGARQILKEAADALALVPVEDDGIFQDYDTPEDLAAAERNSVTQSRGIKI